MAPCENISSQSDFLQAGVKSNEGTLKTLVDEVIVSNSNCTFWNGSTNHDMMLSNCSLAVSVEEVPVKLNKFQIIKAVVLAGVTVVIMISICRMVFQLFVRSMPGSVKPQKSRSETVKAENRSQGLSIMVLVHKEQLVT